MGTAILDMPHTPLSSEIGSLGALYEPSSFPEPMGRSEQRLIGELGLAIDKLLLSAIDCRSASEFILTRKRVWPRYVRALRSLSETISNLLDEDLVEELGIKASAGLAEDIEKSRSTRFSDQLTDQALFTLWTMGKIRSISRKINLYDLSPEKREVDVTLIAEYTGHSLWAQFHLDSLIASMKFDRIIAEDVQVQIVEGLRAAVNAHVVIQEGYELRHPKGPEDVSPIDLPWSEEDNRLLASSMRDINLGS